MPAKLGVPVAAYWGIRRYAVSLGSFFDVALAALWAPMQRLAWQEYSFQLHCKGMSKTSNKFDFRATNERDVSYIARLNFLTDTFGDEHGELSKGFDQDTDFYVHSWKPEDGVIIFDQHFIPAGGIWWTWGDEQHHGRGFVDAAYPEIAIAVEARFGGMGLAGELFRRCFERLEAEGVPGVSLCVSDDNDRARNVYERMGFELVRQSDEGYQVMQKVF